MQNILKSLKNGVKSNSGLTFFYITPLLVFLISEAMEFGSEKTSALAPNQLAFWVNLMGYYGVFILIRAISRRTHFTICFCSTVFFICGVVMYYSIAMRNTPISPWDLLATGTALSVMKGFNLFPPIHVWAGIFGIALIIFISHRLKKAGKYNKLSLRDTIESIAASLVLLISFTLVAFFGQGNFYVSTWRQVSANRRNGYFLNFVMNCGTMYNPKPTGYSSQSADEIIKKAENTYKTEKSDVKPNIIAIMNETFADLSYLGDLGLTNPDDVMPFVRSLSKDPNAITGHLVVPAFGGGTCNSEYEFLTSNSYAFFQSGSYPMLQYVRKNTESLASVLSAQGYQTMALHPYYATGWGRNRAYPNMGFDSFLSMDDFDENAEILRRYISDKSSFEKIIEQYEKVNSESDDPFFCFNVTMQNHCAYDTKYDNFPEDVEFEDEAVFPNTKQYLSLIKRSDKSIKKLIKYFKSVDEPTIIVLFGDHQPYIENSFYNRLMSGSEKSSAEVTMDQHTVPFFIWANYDIEGYDAGRISANYLGPLTLDTANLEMSEYQEYVYSLMKDYPVISCVGSIDPNGILSPLEVADHSEYKIVQYSNVFEKTNKRKTVLTNGVTVEPKQAEGSGSAA